MTERGEDYCWQRTGGAVLGGENWRMAHAARARDGPKPEEILKQNNKGIMIRTLKKQENVMVGSFLPGVDVGLVRCVFFADSSTELFPLFYVVFKHMINK
jgi:hypothetical protein